MKYQDSNIFNHPEIKSKEIFLTNESIDFYENLKFFSKRMGKNSYDGRGNRILFKNWKPIFINISELKNKNLNITQIRLKIRQFQIATFFYL